MKPDQHCWTSRLCRQAGRTMLVQQPSSHSASLLQQVSVLWQARNAQGGPDVLATLPPADELALAPARSLLLSAGARISKEGLTHPVQCCKLRPELSAGLQLW